MSSTGVDRSCVSSSHMTPDMPGSAASSLLSSAASVSVRFCTITRVFGTPEPNSEYMRSSATVLSASSGR